MAGKELRKRGGRSISPGANKTHTEVNYRGVKTSHRFEEARSAPMNRSGRRPAKSLAVPRSKTRRRTQAA